MTDLYYEQPLLVRSEQVNMKRVLRTSELFKLLEEASIAHTEALGCTRHRTLDRGLLWVITRQSVEIDALPDYDDEITVRSWPGPMMHVFFPRHYEIVRNGKGIIRGEALWVLIDERTRQIAMPEEYGIEIPGVPDAPEVLLPPIRIPSDAPAFTQALETRFSQVDINGHMNNTRYFDVIDDAMGVAFHDTASPRSIQANYLSELRAGDSYTLCGYRDGDTWYYEGTADKPAFRAAVTYEIG